MAGVLDLSLELEVWPWIWLVVAVVFALIELTVLAGSFVLLPFAVSAFAASLAGFYGASIEMQWALFGILGTILWIGFWKYAKRFVDDNAMPAGVGAGRLIGMTAIVTVDIDPDDTDRRGRVKVLGETWGALTDATRPVPIGSKVTITAVNGTRVQVEPVVLAAPTEPPVSPPGIPSAPSSGIPSVPSSPTQPPTSETS